MAPIATLLTSALAGASIVSALNAIAVKEQELVDSSTGQRFVIVGVDYQPGGSQAYHDHNTQDPLSNGTVCLRDAALMQQLGINTIRSYNLDPTLNHDECASIFNEVGIYMIIDVNSPLSGQSINQDNPSSTYDSDYLSHIFSVVESFKSYPNTLGFFSGNEIINSVATAKGNPKYIRAVQRDLKNYIKNHAKRTIPVGYSAADVRLDGNNILQDTWNYLQCDNGDNGLSRSDFFGLNSYSWCGSGSSFQTAGYDVLVDMFDKSSIPVFFSEYGCNKPAPRVFDEVPTIYGPQMTVLSGGLVYEWTQETDMYGLIQNNDNGTCDLLPDYYALQGQYAKINTTLLMTANNTATNLQAPKCDKSLITSDKFDADFDIPDPPPGAEAIISKGVSNAPTGSVVSVTQTVVQVAVYATNGAELKGLKITPVQGANKPGNTGGVSSGAAAASSSKGMAPRMMDKGFTGGAVAAVVFGAAFAL